MGYYEVLLILAPDVTFSDLLSPETQVDCSWTLLELPEAPSHVSYQLVESPRLSALSTGCPVRNHHLLKRGDKILLDLVVRKACATAPRERLHLPAIPSVGVYPP